MGLLEKGDFVIRGFLVVFNKHSKTSIYFLKAWILAGRKDQFYLLETVAIF